jgi:hypothetical protein
MNDEDFSTTKKRCSKCHEELTFDCFNKNKNRKYGLDHYCKKCRSEKRRSESKEKKVILPPPPEKKEKDGITIHEYLFTTENNKRIQNAICKWQKVTFPHS